MNDRVNIHEVAKKVAHTLASASEAPEGGALVSLPYIYPSGAFAVAHIASDNNRDVFFITDYGMGYEEAFLAGAGSTFARTARRIAKKKNVKFDGNQLFLSVVPKEQIVAAVIAVSDASVEAARHAIETHATQRADEMREALLDRLSGVVPRKRLHVDAELSGFSSHKWKVDILAEPKSQKRIAIDIVSPGHANSLTSTYTKFSDIAQSNNAPRRVSVLRSQAQKDAIKLLSRVSIVKPMDAKASEILFAA